MKKMIDLTKFAGGALAEQFNIALKEVLEYIADRNTTPKAKRILKIELKFTPDEERELSLVDIVVKTKLEPQKGVATKILIDKDGNGGIIASEYNNQIKGQQYMKIDEESGKITNDSNEVDLKGI